MRPLLFISTTLAALLMAMSANAGSQEASGRCPPDSAGRTFSGLLICIPKDNDRYHLTSAGIDRLYWIGDAPVPPPADSGSKNPDIKTLDMTIASVLMDFGTPEQANGVDKPDKLMQAIAGSILKAAGTSKETFVADLAMGKSSEVQQYKFQRLDSGILRGDPLDRNVAGPVLLLRPSTGDERPHLLSCTVGNEAHVCLDVADVAGHPILITVAGNDFDRIYRISEQVSKDLARFAGTKTP